MVKIIVGFVASAALAIFVLMSGGSIDLSGEHSAQEAMKSESSSQSK